MPDFQKQKCEFIRKEDLWDRVEAYRSRYWPTGSFPVDVELIAELAGYEIVPKKDINDFDAFLSLNLSTIIVNGRLYDNPRFERRIRFSIAHELGHAVLHSGFIRKQRIESVEDYAAFLRSMSDEEYYDFEWQANEFGGRLLVPHTHLATELHALTRKAIESGLSYLVTDNPDLLRSRMSVPLARSFEVSEEVIERRLEREGLWPPVLED